MTAHILTLPEELQSEARRFAESEGRSADEWIAEAVSEKIAGVRAQDFFRRRANGRKLADLKAILDRVPSNPPDPGDELPEGWTRKG